MEIVSDFVKSSSEATDERSISSTKEENIRPPKLCLYYSNYEFCRYGDNCKFLHRRKPAPKHYVSKSFTNYRMEKSQTKRYTPASGIKDKFTFDRDMNCPKNPNHKQLCRFYKAGHCDQGDKCLYSHSMSKNSSCSDASLQAFPNPTQNTLRASSSKKISVPICQYFKRGFCNKGNRCKFYHPQKFTPTDKSYKSSRSVENQSSPHYEESDQNRNFKLSSSEMKENECEMNKDENLSHDQIHSNTLETEDSKTDVNITNDLCENIDGKCTEVLLPSNEPHATSSDLANVCNISKDIRRPLSAKQVFDLSSSDSETLLLRSTEINQFKKRFPNHEVIEENKTFSFIFQPTDPDWPFDTKLITLQVMFPELYPKEICDISVIQSDEYISETLLKHLNQSVSDWLYKRHEISVESKQVELVFRPFLKWFDRNLEEMFNCGLKRAKQDIETSDDTELSSSEDFSQPPEATVDIEEKGSVLPEISVEEMQLTKQLQKSSISEQKHNQNTYFCSSQKQGVKVLFIGLEFVEGVAALTCTKISATLQCIRCKTSHNIKSAPNRNCTMSCSKCSKSLECNFNPSLLHPYSNVLGTMHLMECQVVDINLVECAFLIDCLSCSKQVGVDGIHYGQKQKLWCRFCNQKLLIGIGSVKFQASAPTYTASKAADKPAKKTEKKKDPLIKEGSPLPQFGACKHYKKSNRWLRFPCCGRVYPCDVCHEEKEMDHEMKFASRMICGFCSKEQPYSKDKPCATCGSGVVAKSGTHWEGGKGCRNKVKMSRDDKHKYAGTCKTVSKKSQGSGNKKK